MFPFGWMEANFDAPRPHFPEALQRSIVRRPAVPDRIRSTSFIAFMTGLSVMAGSKFLQSRMIRSEIFRISVSSVDHASSLQDSYTFGTTNIFRNPAFFAKR